jgi:hypothetical protein
LQLIESKELGVGDLISGAVAPSAQEARDCDSLWHVFRRVPGIEVGPRRFGDSFQIAMTP